MSQSSNVFEALQKYGSHAPENYLTESFVYLLDLLLIREPAAGLKMINQLCGLGESEQLTDASAIKIDTQVSIKPHGIVDIRIRKGNDVLFYVEVKHDSPLNGDQLAAYRKELFQHHEVRMKGLVFLARSREGAVPTRLNSNEYHRACWYEIYDRLQPQTIHDEVVKYFAADFQGFLSGKGMNFLQVNAGYSSDTTAMNNLMHMLRAAIGEAIPGADLQLPRSRVLHGFIVWKFFCGVRFAIPDVLVFEDNKGRSPTLHRVLHFVKENFYTRDKDAQFEQIVHFLREAYTESLKRNF